MDRTFVETLADPGLKLYKALGEHSMLLFQFENNSAQTNLSAPEANCTESHTSACFSINTAQVEEEMLYLMN